MKTFLLIGLLILTTCNSHNKQNDNIKSSEVKEVLDSEFKNYQTITVTKIENGKDGYTAHLVDEGKMTYTMVVSIPNLEDNYVHLEVGDKVKVIGDYAESIPVRIYAKRILKVE